MSEHLNTQEGIVDGDLEIQEPVVLDAALEKAIADYAAPAYEGRSFSNQLEGATYNESFAEFMGGLPSVVDAETYAVLAESNDEISAEAQAEFSEVGNIVAQNALDANNVSLPEQTRKLAMTSTIATNFAHVGGGEPTEVVVDASTPAQEGEPLSFWHNHPKLQKALLVGMSSLGFIMGTQPAAAGDRAYREQIHAQAQLEKDRVVNDARAAGINILFGVVRSALERQGIRVDPSNPVPIPGTNVPVYGGGAGVPPPVVYGGVEQYPRGGMPGGYESDSRLLLKQQLIGQQQLLRRQADEERNYATAERDTYNKLMSDPSNVQLRRDYINYQAARANQRITMEQTVNLIRDTQRKLDMTP